MLDYSLLIITTALEMGFNDTLGTYLITAQSRVLMSASFRDDTETNKLLGEALDNLLKPYDGSILQVSDRAALRYASIFFKKSVKYELYWFL